jgi:hypothetical protein
MKKKTRIARGIVVRDLPAFMSRSIFWFILIFLASPEIARAVPDEPAVSQSTWDLRVEDAGPCTADPGFVDELIVQVPAEKRPPAGQAADLGARLVMHNREHATITVVDGSSGAVLGGRDVPLPLGNCRAAAETIGFVLTVLIQSGRDFPSPTESEPVAPVAPPSEAAEPPPPAEERPMRRLSERYAWLGPPPAHEVSLQVGTSYGLVPGIPIGARGAWTIRAQSAWPVTLWASGWRSTSTDAANAKFGAIYGGVAVCPLHAEPEGFHVRLCASIAAGAAYAQARDPRLYERAKFAEILVLPGIQASFAVRLLGPLFADATVQADMPLPRRSFSYQRIDDSAAAIYRTGWVVPAAYLGLSLRFR